MAVKTNIDALVKRISVKSKRYRFDNAESGKRLIRIALLLENQTKINIRRQGIVDTGNLLNSIQSRVKSTATTASVEYGSFGTKYAAMNEFGGVFTDRMRRAMFASFANRGAPKKEGKKVIVGSNWRARPYLRPSLIQQRRQIMKILKDE